MTSENEINSTVRLLVAVDFSDCCRRALRKVVDFVAGRKTEFIFLHVIDQKIVRECISTGLFSEADIKKKLFIDAKTKLKALTDEEVPNCTVETIVREGVPYLEINRKAAESDVDIIVIGSCGMAGDTENVFFGGTAEKVMRFTKRPVFCVPPEA